MTPQRTDHTLELVKKKLEMRQQLDRILDQEFGSELAGQLASALGHVARSVARTAFVVSTDPYAKRMVLSADGRGRSRDDLVSLFAEIAGLTGCAPLRVRAPNAGLRFLTVPMAIDGQRLGVLGMAEPADAGDVVREKESLLEEASFVLDSLIRNGWRASIERDELNLAEELDRVADRELDLEACVSGMLTSLVDCVAGSYAVVLEEGSRRLIGASSPGEGQWRLDEALRLRVNNKIDETCDSPPVVESLDAPDEVSGVTPPTALVRRLETVSGHRAGTLVLSSSEAMGIGHFRLMERAALTLDTVIVGGRRTRLLVERYSKLTRSDSLDELIRNPQLLDAREADFALLSADLVGSTAFSHDEPDKLRVFESINAYLHRIAHVAIAEYGAILDKFLGDETLILFGVPISNENAARDALACARRIIDVVDAFKRRSSPYR